MGDPAAATAWLADVKPAPTLTPTLEEWADPIAFVQSVQAEVAQYGEWILGMEGGKEWWARG